MLRVQARHVRATWGRTTEIALEVVGAPPAQVRDGYLPVEALVVGPDEEPTGHIQVSVTAGYLAQLDYSWFRDLMPTE